MASYTLVDTLQGAQGAAGPITPTHVLSGGFFAVPLNQQALAFLNIQNDGDIIISGELVFL